jgi:alkyl hydroperoxide reductase subunit AhpC
MAALEVGSVAPNFNVPACTGKEKHQLKLADFRGKKHVVLAFHPLDWTPAWAAQTSAYQADRDKFAGFDAQVVGMSIDSVFSHVAWQKFEVGMLDYPIGSDFYPHGDLARRYGVLREGPPIPGISERAVFVIDKEGSIRFSKVYELGEVPENEDVFEVLRELAKASATF